MDIAKIRKKFRGVPGQEAERPAAEQEDVPRGAGETEFPENPVPPPPPPPPVVEEAKEAEAGEGDEDATVQLLAFKLAKEEYAFRIDEIEEIVRPQGITIIPNTGPHLLGITSLRGKIIPVIDLKTMLSLGSPGTAGDNKEKILILKGPKGPIGAMVDSVIGVIRPSASRIVETPLHLPDAEMKFIEGVAIVDGRFVSVIRMSEAAAI